MADAPTKIHKVDTRLDESAYGWHAMVFGLPFIAIGAFFSIGGFLELDVIKKGANAPLWVIGVVGLIFLLAGLMAFVRGFFGFLKRNRVARLKKRYRRQPWRYDYDWSPAGIADNAHRRIIRGLLAVGFLMIFLIPFVWWAFLSNEGGMPVKIVVSIFLAICLLSLGTMLYRLAQFIKYGATFLQFSQFPMFIGDTVALGIQNRGFHSIKATLRFVEEKMVEHAGADNKRTMQHECYGYHSETRQITPRPGEFVRFEFDIPDNEEWSNQLIADPAIKYWELVIEADEPGIDFRTTFPLPIYHSTEKSIQRNGNFGGPATPAMGRSQR